MKLSAINVPIFLFLGQPEAGKSCLIKAINPIIEEANITLDHGLPSCTLYIAKHAAYLKLPGDVLVLLSPEQQKQFFRMLHKKLPCLKKHLLFRYIITVWDIDDMLKRSDTSNRKHMDQLVQIIRIVTKTFGRAFKLQCLLNKADLIPGFIEYFGFRDKEFKEQLWGFSLEKHSEPALSREFNTLIQRLNQQVFWCLQQTDTPEKRYAVKGFPLRMEEVKIRLIPLLHYVLSQLITSSPAISLEKLCLVSCRQYPYIEGHRHSYTLINMTHFKEKHRIFFLKEGFKQMIMEHNNQSSRYTRIQYLGFTGLSIALIAAYTYCISQQFSSSMLELQQQQLQWQALTTNAADFDQAKKTLSAMDAFIARLEQQHNKKLLFNAQPTLIAYAKNSREHFFSAVWEPALAKHKAWFASLSPETRASLLLKTHIAEYPLSSLSISSAYTITAFSKIKDTVIPKLAQEALPSNTDPTSLIEHLRTTYVTSYAQTWEDLMLHAALPTTADTKTLGEQLSLLASPDSPLLGLLKQVYDNTHLPEIEAESSYLHNINQTLNATSSPEDNPLYQSFMAMRTLASTCNKTDSEAFALLLQSLQHDNPLRLASEHLPHPLNDWMLSLADQYNHELSQHVGHYINNRWQNMILKPFHDDFSTRYPFNKEARESVDLAQFTAFFKKNGTLDQFENKDFLPLLTQTDEGWSINLRIAQYLQVPHQVIEQLRSLATLQTTYFGEKETLAYAAFSAYVSKKPVTIKTVQLKIGESLFTLTSSEKIANAFSWPNSIDDLELIVLSSTHQQSETFTGSWAWFKLVDKYAVKREKSRIVLRIPLEQEQGNIEITLLLPHPETLNTHLFSDSSQTIPKEVLII